MPGGLVAAARELPATSGLRSSATAAVKWVTGMPAPSKTRNRRQMPARRAVLVVRLDREVALPSTTSRELVVAVVLAVAHGEGLLGALLELTTICTATAPVLPAHLRRVLAVTDELARRPVDSEDPAC